MQLGKVPIAYLQLKVTNEVTIDSVIGRFRTLGLLCHPDQGGTREVVFQVQRAHRKLTDPDARNLQEFEGCEAAVNVLRLEKNLDSSLFLLRCQQTINSLADTCFFLAFSVVILFFLRFG